MDLSRRRSLFPPKSWAAIKRGKVAEVREYYFTLTKQDTSYPATKAGLIEECERILSERAAVEARLRRRNDTARDAADRQRWREDNAKAAAANNAIFAAMPPMPFWGEE